MRRPVKRSEQKLKDSKSDEQALHSSHCLWELLTLLANTFLVWVNSVRKNTQLRWLRPLAKKRKGKKPQENN